MKIDIARYKQIVVLTGAGVSAASGIRTYRGKDGVWEEYDVQEYGHVDRLEDEPRKSGNSLANCATSSKQQSRTKHITHSLRLRSACAQSSNLP